MVDAPNIGVLLDVWDLHVSGGSPENVRGLTAEQVVAVQLADMPAEEIPLAELTEASRMLPAVEGGMGYDGPVSLKPARQALGRTRRDPIVREIADAMNRIWRAAGLTADGKLSAPAAG